MVGTEVGYMKPRTGSGNRSEFPDIDVIFTPEEVPGLNLETEYQTTTGFVEVDYREPLNARKGGWYRVNFSRYKDRGDQYSFRRTDIDLRQFFGFFSERRVIALRGWFSTADAIDDTLGQPFFLMPTLGGNDTLRGFRDYRFRAPHALLLQAEYRYEIWSGLDGALFYDAGQVALDRSDFRMKNMERDYGFGFRFNTDNGIVLRVDAAFGSADGKHLHIVFGGVF
jgi:outer membrane protein assembly factor BamA